MNEIKEQIFTGHVDTIEEACANSVHAVIVAIKNNPNCPGGTLRVHLDGHPTYLIEITKIIAKTTGEMQ